MLSSFARCLSNESVMKPFRDAAHAVAAEFVQEEMKQFFHRWADHTYEEGMSMKDEKQLNTFADLMRNEIEALKRQSKIQQMYQNVNIMS